MENTTSKSITDGGNIPESQIATAAPPRAISIKKDDGYKLNPETAGLVLGNATATIWLPSFDVGMIDAFVARKIGLWSDGDGIVTMKLNELSRLRRALFVPSLVAMKLSAKEMDSYKWSFHATPNAITLSSNNMSCGLTPENIARMLRRTIRVSIQAEAFPVLFKYKVDKSGNQHGIRWLKSFSQTGYRFPRYLDYDPVEKFNAVADLRDAHRVLPKVDKRYYYSAA